MALTRGYGCCSGAQRQPAAAAHSTGARSHPYFIDRIATPSYHNSVAERLTFEQYFEDCHGGDRLFEAFIGSYYCSSEQVGRLEKPVFMNHQSKERFSFTDRTNKVHFSASTSATQPLRTPLCSPAPNGSLPLRRTARRRAARAGRSGEMRLSSQGVPGATASGRRF